MKTFGKVREVEEGFYVIHSDRINALLRFANTADNIGLKGDDARDFANYVNNVLTGDLERYEEES